MFGDSFTTPNFCVDAKDSFWYLVAQAVGAKKICNCSWSGNSFDSIMHMVVSMQDQYNWEEDLFLIGIPPLWRVTIFDDYKDTQYYGTEFDLGGAPDEKFRIASHNGLKNFLVSDDKMLTVFSDRAWTETQTLRNIFLLTAWLDARNARYQIVNLSEPLDRDNKWGPSEFVLPYVENHSKCIVFEDTYQSINVNINRPADFEQYGWLGHHGPAGNRYFFEKSLLPNMQKCGLV